MVDIFKHLAPFKVLVLGDFVLDAYTTGRVKRVSPEAPVPVLEVQREEERPGGAGNVVLNLLALGATVFAAGRVGDDAAGKRLAKLLKNADTRSLVVEETHETPVKTRLIASSQQLLRIDRETIAPLSLALEEKIIQNLEELIPNMQIVAISDYGKGFLTPRILRSALDLCRKHKIPSIVDPKGIDFSKYQGATILKPNLSEALNAAGVNDLNTAARKLRAFAETLLITRSEEGISVFENDERFDFPVRFHEVKDVTGAGDTVLSILCLALANGLDIQTGAKLANIAAGIAIERVGCVQVTLPELAERLLETKVFDEHHMFALSQSLKNKRYALLNLDKGQVMSASLFKTISNLAQEELIIHIEAKEDDPFVQLLSSLREVKSIILEKKLCKLLKPHTTYSFKKDQLLLQ